MKLAYEVTESVPKARGTTDTICRQYKVIIMAIAVCCPRAWWSCTRGEYDRATQEGHDHSACLSQFMALVLHLDSCTCWMVDTLGWATARWVWGTAEGMAAEVVGGDDTSFGFWILRNDWNTDYKTDLSFLWKFFQQSFQHCLQNFLFSNIAQTFIEGFFAVHFVRQCKQEDDKTPVLSLSSLPFAELGTQSYSQLRFKTSATPVHVQKIFWGLFWCCPLCFSFPLPFQGGGQAS